MKAHVLHPAAAPLIATAVGLPAAQPVALIKRSRRVEALVESVIFYGLLAFGFSAPLVGATYALLFR